MTLEEAINFKQPVIELDWAKNKKSSYKGISYYHFTTEYSKLTEYSKEPYGQSQGCFQLWQERV